MWTVAIVTLRLPREPDEHGERLSERRDEEPRADGFAQRQFEIGLVALDERGDLREDVRRRASERE